MARLNELWRETGGPGLPPCPDSGRVKARVNAALDAGPAERKITMKKWRMVLAAAAALAAITGTAFAAAAHWDMLAAWFQGDTAPGQAYVDSQPRSVSDENYTLTVESSARRLRSSSAQNILIPWTPSASTPSPAPPVPRAAPMTRPPTAPARPRWLLSLPPFLATPRWSLCPSPPAP